MGEEDEEDKEEDDKDAAAMDGEEWVEVLRE